MKKMFDELPIELMNDANELLHGFGGMGKISEQKKEMFIFYNECIRYIKNIKWSSDRCEAELANTIENAERNINKLREDLRNFELLIRNERSKLNEKNL